MPLYCHDPQWTRWNPAGVCEPAAADLMIRRYTVALPGAAPAPCRLAFFSDLHWDGEPAARLRLVIETINAAAPELVLFGGDLVSYAHHIPDALRQLAHLRARQACLAVRGNRESACAWLTPDFWHERYAQVGFRYLHNQAWVPAATGLPAVVGIDDARHGRPDFAAATQAAAGGRAVITLTHNPDAVGRRPDTFLGHLVLSGHTHGGQYRLPGLGALFTSSRYWRQFDYGWRRRRDGARLYITAGTGEAGQRLLRRRLLCPPELVFITLVGTTAAPGSGPEAP